MINQLTRRPAIALLLTLTLCYLVSFISVQASLGALQGWYQVVSKPVWAVPAWAFILAWSVLYGLVGLAAWLVWTAPSDGDEAQAKTIPAVLFFVYLSLHGIWPGLFFIWQKLGPAFMVAAILWAVVAAMAWSFGRVRPIAAVILFPTFLWIAYIFVLNLSIWRLTA